MEELKQAIELFTDEIEWKENNLENAISIFKKIKENEKLLDHELINAKKDLELLGIETKGLTNNQIYLKHQSELVNRIYMILEEA